MPFYWSYNAIPELASLPKARRKAIWKECCQQVRTPKLRALIWGWLVANLFLISIPALCIPDPQFRALRPARLLYQLVVALLLWPVGTHFRIILMLPEIRRRVGGLCLQCGYDLRASKERCPECGTTFSAPTPSTPGRGASGSNDSRPTLGS
jgi:hypothetical protein